MALKLHKLLKRSMDIRRREPDLIPESLVCPYNIILALSKTDKTPHYTKQHVYKLHIDMEMTFISSA